MPRRLLERNNQLPYHVTARANNRETFSLELSRLWKVMGEECLFLTLIYGVQIHAFVLMPNHIHMILTVPENDLGKIMNEFMKSVSRRVNRLTGRSGHVFGGPYYWSLINNSRYFGHALKYVYRNPVKAKLCETPEDYPFTTLQGLLGIQHLPFPIYMTRVGMEITLPAIEAIDQLIWLKTPFPAEAEKLLQKGLRQKLFDVVLDPRTRAPSELLSVLL